MFLNEKVLNNLMKQAYKTDGLVVAQNEDNWVYIAGRFWEVEIKREYIPKQTLANIIALAGELPVPRERFRSDKQGNQYEMEMLMSIDVKPYTMGPLTVTNTLQIGTAGTVQRYLQDTDTGMIYLLNEAFISLREGSIDEEHGEYAPSGPFYSKSGVIWQNNICRMTATFRHDRKNKKTLDALKGVDLTPSTLEDME
jgi:hypothetical protein